MKLADLDSKLNALILRARDDSGETDLVPAIGLVNDLGRLSLQGSLADVRKVQAAVASLREQLDGESVEKNPAKELGGKDRHVYLAGAMWAVNEVMTSRLQLAEATKSTARRSRKSELIEALLATLTDSKAHTPTEMREADTMRHLKVRPDEVSRALTDLVDEGLVYLVPSPSDAGRDRRRKFFALSPAGSARQAHRAASARLRT
jgi:hypothetical protein